MELGEGEAQICRLCGQCERIYIDVFGEEGTKRFLGLKIHTKINILIKENDGLPHIVCIRCIGTLEFLCDFYETCHLTQMELSEGSKNKIEESDAESDKENAFPSMYDAKRKIKVPSPSGSKSTKHGLVVNNGLYYSTETKDGSNSLYRVDNNDRSNKVQSVMQMTVQKCTKGLALEEKGNVSKGTIIRNRRSESLNSTVRSSQNASNSIQQPLRRKRGRKSKLEKMKEASVYLSLKRKLEKHAEDEKNKDNPYKRHYLHTIWINNKSNLTKNSVILSKPQVERVAKGELVVNTLSNVFHNENSKTVTIPDDNTVEIETNVKDSEITEGPIKKNEDNSMKSKAISVIVKQEKGEAESAFSQQTREIDQLVWIPNDVLIQEQETLIDSPLKEEVKQITNKKSNFTAEYDDAEHSNVSTITDHKDLKSEIFEEQNRVSVIKSFQTNGSPISKKMEEVKTEVYLTTNATSQSIKDDSESDDADLSFMQPLSPDSKFSRNRSKDRSFAKITELISDEQKEAIETFYTVDMSIVNPVEVQKNLTIIDKKNIRCNICGTFYLRMDKCQVHIWGHLKMKPYQCKACDFSTVTVTNVRCHIRKSHLKIKPFECHLCERKYVTAVLLEEHINTHTGARPFKCKLCDFTSASRQMLSYHGATHKPKKDINCKICDKEFYSRGRLRAHMIIHNKDKFVVCKLCSAYLSSQEALKTHHKNVHSQDYVCNVCGKHVQSRKALHNHQNVHAAAKYKCSLCPNMYKSSQILKEHLLKHEGIRKYKCTVCEKSFGQQSHVAAHMAVHSKIRFHCPGCDKPFNRHDNMKMHTKRCQLFLANPDLKNRIVKKERNIFFKKPTELNEDSMSGDTSNSATHVEDQNVEPLMKTVDKKEEVEMNLCKIGLNISCIKSMNETWRCDDVYKEAGEITGSAEINLIQITGVNDNFIPESENLIVRETILGPESF
ncbi:zinc finger protein 37-like [Colletes gigas]|uniref:zinc finger protein 37-like n=1 Tax=Colletes gigas TaxID=935657 RepID=UPI001C9A9538|nr:zinc finger protein 37-like [Colletes gigas]